MKILRIILHLLQIGLLYGIYLVRELYANHLGFMRNVSFYSQKFENSMIGSKVNLLPLVFLVLALLLIIKKVNLERILLLFFSLFFLGWLFLFKLQTMPIYYLVCGILCLIALIQIIIATKRS
ncbi:hypothetical protein RV04_GL000980 [Enterococcus hermanniensis]|uniref:Uncharacterized protein n=1 Tax=Enterococcus hermanniensis TaxID=249189 RepID=A0A1L8TQY9_9ENTE|nr:hypothetical protein RV04_GL000980 [Enterococcus hermanniensis]